MLHIGPKLIDQSSKALAINLVRFPVCSFDPVIFHPLLRELSPKRVDIHGWKELDLNVPTVLQHHDQLIDRTRLLRRDRIGHDQLFMIVMRDDESW